MGRWQGWLIVVAACTCLRVPSLLAEPTALWMRYPAISPDGKTIAFSFQGNLFTVPTSGGRATPITTSPRYDVAPVWSPDSKTLAFASDRAGNLDVYTVPSLGGQVTRLTFHSVNETPTSFTPDGKAILFSAARLDSPKNAMFPAGNILPELYQVPIQGGRPRQVLTTPALHAQPDGEQLVYEDRKGYENLWRKHHTSAVTHDIWRYNPKTGSHTQLTNFPGEDRNPVVVNGTIYYLSEQSGSFNVWRLESGKSPVAVTKFTKNPVRFLSTSRQGELCFGYDGGIYVKLASEADPRQVPIEIPLESQEAPSQVKMMTSGATEMSLSPKGKELALIVRGDVFVVSIEQGVTRRITSTPEQERSVSFSPDGKKLLFAGERKGAWNLYETTIGAGEETYFYAATVFKTKTLLANGEENFQPYYSPDGKEVAYLQNRTTLNILNLDTNKTRTVLAGNKNYSYRDGDQWFDWSPDSKWLLVHMTDPHRWSYEIGLIDAEGQKAPLNLTNSGYEDYVPRWMMKGKMMLWFSDRDGLTGTGSTDRNQSDVYGMFFTQEAYDRFKLDKAEFELVKEKEEKAAKETKEKDKKKTESKTLTFDLENLEERTSRLTINSSELADAQITPDGEKLLYLSKVEKGYDLWVHTFRENETKILAKLGAEESDGLPVLMLDKTGETVYILASGQISKITIKDSKSEPVKYAAEVLLNPRGERDYLFEHVWRQARAKFYTTDLHGVDWNYYKKTYQKFLPSINNNWDFAELLSEMLGELNASHTGSGYIPSAPDSDQTASLGVFYDNEYGGPGFKIAEVMDKGPLKVAKSEIKAGMIIEKIDGVTITAGAEFDTLLNRKAEQPVLLSAYDPIKNRRWEERIIPISRNDEGTLLYKRWVKSRRDLTAKLSGGKVGYVHVEGMDDQSFRTVYAEVLGRNSGKESLIVDTRFNGGGNLAAELANFLQGKEYLKYSPRGQVLGAIPDRRWTRKSVVLMGESNYSDAHIFPTSYKLLNIGKTIGMPVPGTGTYVWWETLQDPTLYFGIPEVGVMDAKGRFLENQQLEPDISIANDYSSVAKGEDKQLQKAVEVLLKDN